VTLDDLLRRQATDRADHPYVVTDTVTWTYAEVDRLADRTAAGLAALDVRPGDTVALMMATCAEVIPLTFGINRLGAIWVPTNVDYKGEWLRQTLEDGRARVLVVDADLLPRVLDVLDGLPIEHLVVRGDVPDGHLGLDDLFASAGDLPAVELHESDTAAVLWTSGTTGRSKGVMQPHKAWLRAARTGAESSQTTPDDVLYCCLPLYNSAAWVGVIYRALHAGATVALDPAFSVHAFWDRVRRFGATQAFTLGSMHLFLWQAPARPDDADNPLRSLGATPMPDAIMDAFKERFGIEIIQQGYGQSEVMGLVTRIDDGGRDWKPNSAGVALEGVEIKLLDDDDREVPVGEVGEFCVRPLEPFILFNGYFHQPEATLEAFRNLWYHTGDLGRADEDGQFFFVDRKKDYIRFKGRSVSSFAVEAAVRAHPEVSEVAAFGVTTGELASEGEVMVAVVREEGATVTEEEIARFVNDTAPYFFVPRFIEFVDEIPHTPTGKVQKYVLRDKGASPRAWDRDAAGFELRR
jgi:carnitine-CoA ligase